MQTNNYYSLVIHYEQEKVGRTVRVIGPFRTPELAVDEAVNHWGFQRPEPTKRGNAIVFGKLYSSALQMPDDIAYFEVASVEIPRGPHGWEA